MSWLESCGRSYLEQHGAASSPMASSHGPHGLSPLPAPAHVYCIAAALWHSQKLQLDFNLQATVSRDLLR